MLSAAVHIIAPLVIAMPKALGAGGYGLFIYAPAGDHGHCPDDFTGIFYVALLFPLIGGAGKTVKEATTYGIAVYGCYCSRVCTMLSTSGGYETWEHLIPILQQRRGPLVKYFITVSRHSVPFPPVHWEYAGA